MLPAADRDYRASANNPAHFCEVEKDRYFSERGKEVQDGTVLLTVFESNLERNTKGFYSEPLRALPPALGLFTVPNGIPKLPKLVIPPPVYQMHNPLQTPDRIS